MIGIVQWIVIGWFAITPQAGAPEPALGLGITAAWLVWIQICRRLEP